jgi:hypothetical protein
MAAPLTHDPRDGRRLKVVDGWRCNGCVGLHGEGQCRLHPSVYDDCGAGTGMVYAYNDDAHQPFISAGPIQFLNYTCAIVGRME